MNIGLIQQASAKKLNEIQISFKNELQLSMILQILKSSEKINDDTYKIQECYFTIIKNNEDVQVLFSRDKINKYRLITNDSLVYTIDGENLYASLAQKTIIQNDPKENHRRTYDDPNLINHRVKYNDLYKYLISEDLYKHNKKYDLYKEIYKDGDRVTSYIINDYYFHNDNYRKDDLCKKRTMEILISHNRSLPNGVKSNKQKLQSFITNFNELKVDSFQYIANIRQDPMDNTKILTNENECFMIYVKSDVIYYIPTINGLQYTIDDNGVLVNLKHNKITFNGHLNWQQFNQFSMYLLMDMTNNGYKLFDLNEDEYFQSVQLLLNKITNTGKLFLDTINSDFFYPDIVTKEFSDTLNAQWSLTHGVFKESNIISNMLEQDVIDHTLGPLGYYMNRVKVDSIYQDSYMFDISQKSHIMHLRNHFVFCGVHIDGKKIQITCSESSSITTNAIRNSLPKDLDLEFVYYQKRSDYLGDRNNNCLIYSCVLYFLNEIMETKQHDNIENDCQEIRDLVNNKYRSNLNDFINSDDFYKVPNIIIRKQINHLMLYNKILNAAFTGDRLDDYLNSKDSPINAHTAYHAPKQYNVYNGTTKSQLLLLYLSKCLINYIEIYNSLPKHLQLIENKLEPRNAKYIGIDKKNLYSAIEDITKYDLESIKVKSIYDTTLKFIQEQLELLKTSNTIELSKQLLDEIQRQLQISVPNINIEGEIKENIKVELSANTHVQTTGNIDVIRKFALYGYFESGAIETSKEQRYASSFDITDAISDQLPERSKIKPTKIEEAQLVITPELYKWMHYKTPEGTEIKSDNPIIPDDLSTKCKCTFMCNCKDPFVEINAPLTSLYSSPANPSNEEHTPTGDLKSKGDSVSSDNESESDSASSEKQFKEVNKLFSQPGVPTHKKKSQFISPDQDKEYSDEDQFTPWNQSNNDFRPTSTQKQNKKNSNWIKDNPLLSLLAIAFVVILVIQPFIDIRDKNPTIPKESNLITITA
jgi:hypothetical protein